MHCRAFWCGLLAKAALLPPPPPLGFHISAEVSAAPLPPPHNEPEASAALRREACGAGGSRIGRAARQCNVMFTVVPEFPRSACRTGRIRKKRKT